ncbi:MAG: type II secretion system protein GspM [Lysobacterales bacterium]
MELINAFKSRWYGLQPREQLILRSSAIILGLLLFYLLIVDPVYSGRDDAAQRLESAREAFSVMQQQAFDLKTSLSNPATSGTGSLLTEVESSAQKEGLRSALKRLQPSGNDQIQVSLEGVSYNQVMQWLSSLHQQGVKAQRVDIQVDRKTDLLAVQLLLER